MNDVVRLSHSPTIPTYQSSKTDEHIHAKEAHHTPNRIFQIVTEGGSFLANLWKRSLYWSNVLATDFINLLECGIPYYKVRILFLKRDM